MRLWLNEKDWGWVGGWSARASWWVCVCVGKTTITFVFLHGSAPLYSRGLASQEQGSAVPVGWRVTLCECECAYTLCLCKTLWQLLSAWLDGGPSLSSLVTSTSADLSQSSDKGHRPRRWERRPRTCFCNIKAQKKLSPKGFTWRTSHRFFVLGSIGQRWVYLSDILAYRVKKLKQKYYQTCWSSEKKQDSFKNNMYKQYQPCLRILLGCPDALEGNLRPKLHDTAHCKVNNKAIS